MPDVIVDRDWYEAEAPQRVRFKVRSIVDAGDGTTCAGGRIATGNGTLLDTRVLDKSSSEFPFERERLRSVPYSASEQAAIGAFGVVLDAMPPGEVVWAEAEPDMRHRTTAHTNPCLIL